MQYFLNADADLMMTSNKSSVGSVHLRHSHAEKVLLKPFIFTTLRILINQHLLDFYTTNHVRYLKVFFFFFNGWGHKCVPCCSSWPAPAFP